MSESTRDLFSSARIRLWAAGLAAVVLVALVYLHAASGGFLWDDDAHITANPTIVGPQGLKEIWTTAAANYFPFTMTSFWLGHALWGLAPAPFHLLSILFHAGCVLLLWRILVWLGIPGAWLGAMLWALHPVQTESVAWICELKNTQSCFFYLLAVLLFVRWFQRAEKLEWRPEYALALVAAAAAILSKASTVMLPVILGLVGWWAGRRRLREALWLAPFLAISLAASIWTIWEQRVHSMASGAEWDQTLAERCVIAGRAIWFYLAKLLWPRPLVFIYPRWELHADQLLSWLPLVAAVVAGGVLWLRRDRDARALFFTAGYFVLSLFPVLGFFNVFFFRYSFVSDHFQYLASIGPMALLGAALTVGVRRLGPSSETMLYPAGAVLLGILGFLTWRQTAIYQNQETLWTDTVARNPNAWIARMNLGAHLTSVGRAAEALPQYDAALALKPNDPLASLNKGAALGELNRNAEAVPYLEAAVAAKPDLAEGHSTLGAVLQRLGRTDEARAHLETAVRLKPDFEIAQVNYASLLIQSARFPEALERLQAATKILPRSARLHSQLGQVLYQLGRRDEAGEHLVTAARLDANDFDAWLGLARYLSQAGRLPEAMSCAANALRLKPNAVEPRYILATALLVSGKPADAIAQYQQVLQLVPDHVDAQSNLGNALYQTGHPADAIPHYRAAVKLKPDLAAFHNNLASALSQTGQGEAAIEEYRQALRLEPGYAEARYNLALTLNTMGRREEAARECEIVLQTKPDHKGAQDLLQHLRGAAAPKK